MASFFLSALLGSQAFSQKASAVGAGDKNVKVQVLYPDKGSKITGLSILAKELQLFFAAGETELRSYVEVPIMFERPGWQLLFQTKVLVDRNEISRPFTVPIYLNKELNSLSLTAVGPNGETEQQSIFLKSLDSFEKKKNRNSWNSLLLDLGLSNLDYYQEGSGNYKAMSWLFSSEYASAPQREGGLGYYSKLSLTALPLQESPVKSGSQFISAKADLSYFFRPSEDSPLIHQLLAGGNYFSLLANGSPFGFNNLLTPDFGYRLHYRLGSGSTLIFDSRYIAFGMPMQFKKFGFSLSSSYTFKPENLNRMEVGIDFLYFQYETTDLLKVKMNTVFLTFGYAI